MSKKLFLKIQARFSNENPSSKSRTSIFTVESLKSRISCKSCQPKSRHYCSQVIVIFIACLQLLLGLGKLFKYFGLIDIWWEQRINYDIGPGGFAYATRGGVAMRSWPLFLLLPTFALLFLSLFLFHLLLLTHFGESPCAKICFPQYFGITRRYMEKQGNFDFFYE